MSNKEIQDKPKDTLYNRCTGYDYYKDVVVKVKTQELSKDGKTVIIKENIKTIKVMKHRKPNLKSQMKWLSKKNKEEWN